jgi:hypothetical protein
MIIVSTVPPQVIITSPATGPTKNNSPVLTYTASKGTVVIKVDGVAVSKVSGATLDTLSDGTHTVRVEATDTLHNTGFAEVSFTVDTVAPVVAITSPAAGTTNNNRPLLSSSVSDGTIAVKVDGVTVNKVSGNSLDPLANGTHTVRVEATDTAGNIGFAAVTFSVNYTTLSVAIATLPWGTTGVPFSQTVTAAGGVAPYSWLITSGSLPSGLALNAATGAITGTPTATGTGTFTIQVTDANSATASKPLSITMYAPLAISTTALPTGTVGTAYSQILTATGGSAPYLWSIAAGALPAGLSLNAVTGAITGTPTTTGSATFTVQVKDANLTASTRSLSITTNPKLPDLIVTAVSGPTSAKKGAKVSLSATVKNQGLATAATSTLTFYLSIDGTITTADISLGDKAVNSLTAGSSQTVTLSVNLPSSSTTGTYYIGAIADRAAVVTESDETNNSLAGNNIIIN